MWDQVLQQNHVRANHSDVADGVRLKSQTGIQAKSHAYNGYLLSFFTFCVFFFRATTSSSFAFWTLHSSGY